MSTFAAAKMATIKDSGIRRILVKAWQLEAAGREIVDFSIGRPDFDTPQPIKDAAVKSLESGQVHYTHSLGIIELRRALAEDTRRRLGLDYDPQSEVMVTAGSTAAIMTTLLTVLNPGDEVIIPEPMYLFYLDWAQYGGAKTVPLPLSPEGDGQLTYEALKSVITSKSKVILINSPHNPTGRALDQNSLEAVAKAAREFDLLVIADEVYDQIVFDPYVHQSIAGLPGMKERSVVVNSFSKTYAMDGWRIGNLFAPADLVKEIEKTQQHTVLNATTFVQWAAVEALSRRDELVTPMLDAYAARRRLLVDLVADCPGLSCAEPQGAFYVWAKVDPLVDVWDLARRFLEQGGVAVTPGDIFGPSGKNYFRISFSVLEEKIEKGMAQIKKVMEEIV